LQSAQRKYETVYLDMEWFAVAPNLALFSRRTGLASRDEDQGVRVERVGVK
jgi:hypothetical protein